jgi:hypothetical protein
MTQVLGLGPIGSVREDRGNHLESTVIPEGGKYECRVSSHVPVFVGQATGKPREDGGVVERDNFPGNVKLLPKDLRTLEFLNQAGNRLTLLALALAG